jgi:two-component system sensor histidine kinase MprB
VTLSRRLTLLFAATAVAVSGAIGALSYVATDHSLDTQLRLGLVDAAATLAYGGTPEGLAAVGEPLPSGDGDDGGPPPSASRSSSAGPPAGATESPDGGHGRRPDLLLAQLLTTDGTVTSIGGRSTVLPVDDEERAAARAYGDRTEVFRVVRVDGARYLMLTRSANHTELVGGAVQVARSLSDRDGVLARLAVSIAAMAFAVAVAAALAGWYLARRLTRRLVRLSAAAEEVTATGRLDVPVPVEGTDEVGRLGTAFDTMLGRLARSKDDQQRLVADAGHELRTPLTSIRTNVSLLRRFDELAPDERRGVLDDLAGESRELSDLVNELVELATDRRTVEGEDDVDLVALAGRVAERAGRRTGRQVDVERLDIGPTHNPVAAEGAPLVVRGRPSALERAVSNLVDNALKFDTGGEPVTIALATGRIEVRDRGPGVPDEDLPRIFDRFHRATAVRSMPGSGLGLSIVRDVATGHGGDVFAANREGGGAVIGFTLPRERFQPASNPG